MLVVICDRGRKFFFSFQRGAFVEAFLGLGDCVMEVLKRFFYGNLRVDQAGVHDVV